MNSFAFVESNYGDLLPCWWIFFIAEVKLQIILLLSIIPTFKKSICSCMNSLWLLDEIPLFMSVSFIFRQHVFGWKGWFLNFRELYITLIYIFFSWIEMKYLLRRNHCRQTLEGFILPLSWIFPDTFCIVSSWFISRLKVFSLFVL